MKRLFCLPIAAALSLTSLGYGQVVITEIMYNPLGVNAYNDLDWFEIYNASEEDVDLEGWALFDQFYLVDNSFSPSDTTGAFAPGDFHGGVIEDSSILKAGEVAVIIKGTFSGAAEDFRLRWETAKNVKIIAPAWGSALDFDAVPSGTYNPITNQLQGGDVDPEWVTLAKDVSDLSGILDNIADTVDYYNGSKVDGTKDFGPGRFWPETGGLPKQSAGPSGASIYLKTEAIISGNPTVNNDSGSNWAISSLSDGVSVNQTPTAWYFSDQTVGSPGVISGIEVAIPEPASIGLILGFTALFGLRRRR